MTGDSRILRAPEGGGAAPARKACAGAAKRRKDAGLRPRSAAGA